MIDDSDFGINKFYNINALFERDKSPEGEFEETRLSRARSSLFLDMPFFGWILGHLEIFATLDPFVPAYAADSRRIYINTLYMRDKPVGRLKGILMHLVIHLIMKHGERGDQKNKEIWGISSDVTSSFILEETYRNYKQNLQLISKDNENEWQIDPIDKIPEILMDDSTENAYEILHDYALSMLPKDEKENLPINESKQKFNEEILDEVNDYAGVDLPCNFIDIIELSLDKMSDDMRRLEDERFLGVLRNAAQHGRDQGYLPASLKSIVNDLLNPKIPWYVLLEQYIQKTVVNDLTWIPPNKRMLSTDFIFPSTEKEFLNVVIGLDTSGSITDQELTKFVTEAHSILSAFASIRLIILVCDAIVQDSMIIEEGQTIDGSETPWEGRALKGRGGTSFIPVFEWIDENSEQPDLLIYFTDGYGSYPNYEPDYPVLWIMNTDYEPPFGDFIKYDTEA